ncbi:hypothetical protein LWI28_002923 [Acer negundo]|uniref:Reverse transcriptase zinc-binding domain-containing protein n=1 Tax=Acer negundo TaxID=4023 RepID=A0AAD5NSW3_ACENE|nr:hypothetical protein LWI28_002923 [Acer negundo]
MGPSGAGGGLNTITAFWKALWKLSIPVKIKLFMWRACNNFLPTNLCLANRKVPVNPICPLCKCSEELTLHALRACRILKPARLLRLLVKVTWYDGISHFFDFMIVCFFHLNSMELGLLCVVLWRNWYIRNAYVHGCPIAVGLDSFE